MKLKLLPLFTLFLYIIFSGCTQKRTVSSNLPKVIISRGRVFIGLQGSRENMPVLVRSRIPNGHVLTTFDDSHLELVIDTDTIVVDANTRFGIDLDRTEEQRNLLFYVSYGKIFFLLNRGKIWEDEWKVTTPTTVMKGKSNGFAVEVDKTDKLTQITVLEGDVIISSKEEEGTINLGAFHSLQMARESLPGKTVEVSEEKYQEIGSWTGNDRISQYLPKEEASGDSLSDSSTN